MIQKAVTYFGQPAVVACDANCDKAWGIHVRPKVQLSADPDDYAFLADDELGIAPLDPGTYEGDDAKPLKRPMTGPDMNRWCVRECERCAFQSVGFVPDALPDFAQRQHNKRWGVLPPTDPDTTAFTPRAGRIG